MNSPTPSRHSVRSLLNASMNSRWLAADRAARRIASLSNGFCSELKRRIGTTPVLSFDRRHQAAVAAQQRDQVGDGTSHQSISPVCSAAAAVAASGMVIHSTRST